LKKAVSSFTETLTGLSLGSKVDGKVKFHISAEESGHYFILI